MRACHLLPSLALAALAWLGQGLAPAHAQSAVQIGTLTGVPPAHKTMRTLRDMRYRDLVQQHYDFSCGSAALASLLRYGYGLDVSETGLIQTMLVGTDPQEIVRNGFSMLDMKRYVSGIGMRAHGFRIGAEGLHRLRMPVIALLDTRGYRHFVLVKGADPGRVYVADPALGHRVIPEQDFLAAWNGIVLAVIGDTPMRADSYLFTSRGSPALQRRVDALDRATTPPPLVELGLFARDLF